MIPYKPEPFTDFSVKENLGAFDTALKKVSEELGKDYLLLIGGEFISTDAKLDSTNPSNRSELIGRTSKANKALIDKAIHVALDTFKTWSRVPAEDRAAYLFKAAAIIRRNKHEWSSWLLLEAGKSRSEADADTAECIDFLEYYGRQILALEERARTSLTALPGEDNRLHYIPLGVGAIIPPWNFPLAIMAGMTMAAVVSGNTVLLKPASQTPIIAAKFVELLQEIGLPAGVVNFVPGDPEEIGDYMTQHPLIRFVSFTGSRDVGLRIHELTSKRSEGQSWMKRFVAEMGGKDSIVVDETADIELAARNIIASAFGFCGQKCSACSRVIAHESIYDALLSRCVELTRDLKVGNVRDSGNYTGPVIDEKSFLKNKKYLEIGKEEGRVVVGGEATDNGGYFVQPTIIADVHPKARVMQEEIFGPIVAFTKVKDFDEALEVANNTEFGLTGSLFSKNRQHIERARIEFHVGNLYFNRKCTGALVGVHPFGGFNMSGTDSKAGGPDYLMQFTQLKSSSEQL